jgi:DNA-binding SARP family transcriptional activator/tetratricopeptide (TPR) repeat protein
MTLITISVLGPLRVGGAREHVELGSRLQRILLLALVASGDDPRTTDGLITDLWGDSPPRRATASLHSYVSRLRRALAPVSGRNGPASAGPGPSLIVSTRNGYRLDRSRFTLDADRFADEIRSARAAEDPRDVVALSTTALGRWRGSPYAEADSHPFAQPEVARLETLRLEADRYRVGGLLDLGELASAQAAAEALALRHPLDEACQGLLIRALYFNGRQSDALAVMSDLRRRLVDQLGVEPSPQLADLEARILCHDPSLAPATTSWALKGVGGGPSGPGPPPVLSASPVEPVGREAERAQLRAALSPKRSGSGPAVITVVGEPGIGKTTLVESVAAAAEEAGTIIVRIRCEQGASGFGLLPLTWALEVAARPWVSGVPIEPETPPDSTPPIYADETTDGSERLASCLRLLRALTDEAPVVMVVDDLHWGGRWLLAALSFLLAQHDLERLTMMVTLRSQPASLDQPEIRRLRSHGPTIVLQGLDPGAIEELAVGAIGPPGHAIAGDLWRRTSGNPLFVQQLLEVLDPTDPVGSLRRSETPASIADAVSTHLDGLDPEVRELLVVASLAGQWFDPLLCARVAGTSKAAIDVVDAAISAGLLVEHPQIPARCSFHHDLIRASVRNRLSSVRRASIHAQLGRAMYQRHGFADETVDEVAEHLARAAAVDNDLLAARAASRAITVALDRHEEERATTIARRAIDLLRGLPSSEQDTAVEAELLTGLAWCLKRTGDPPGCVEAARAAFRLAESAEDGPAMAEAALAFHGGPVTTQWLGYWSPFEEAIDLIERATEALGGPADHPELWFRLGISRAELYGMVNDYRRAEAQAARSLALADEAGELVWRAEAALQLRRVVELHPDDRGRVEAMATVRAVADLTPMQQTLALRFELVSRLEACDATGADEVLGHLHELAKVTGSDLVRLQSDLAELAIDMLMGRLAEAEDTIQQLRKRHRHLTPNRLGVLELQSAYLLYLRHELRTITDQMRDELAAHDTPSWRAPLANALWEAGRPAEAQDLLAAMPDRHFTQPHETSLQFLTSSLLADVVAHLGDRRRATQLSQLLEGHDHRLVAFSEGHILGGWVGLQRGRLLGLLGRHQEAEEVVRAAGDRAKRLRSPLFELWADAALIELDHRAGRPPRSAPGILASTARELGYGAPAFLADGIAARHR